MSREAGQDGLARGAGPRWEHGDTLLCAALVTALVATRIAWIRGYPLSAHYWEEGYRWIAVHELSAGTPVPWLEWQADHYQGSSFVVIALATTLCGLGVAPLVALKCVALGFASATCAALYAIGRIFFGRAVGLLCGLAYLAGPPLVAFWGVVAMGFHAESALLSLIGFGACLTLAERRAPTPLGWLAFGLLSGLAMWFSPTAALGVLACAIAWPFVALRRPDPRELLAGVAGAAAGLAPWLFYNAQRGFPSIRRALEVFGAEASPDAFRSQGLVARAGDLFLRAPGQGLLDPGGDAASAWRIVPLAAAVWVPVGIALIAAWARALGALRWGRRAPLAVRRESLFLLYGALFAVAYLASRFTLPLDPTPIGFRLLVPPAILLLPPVAISAARAMRPGAPYRHVSRIASGVCLVALAFATVAFARQHREPGTPLDWKHAHVAWGHILQRKHGADIAAAVASVGWLAPDRREDVLLGIGWGLESAFEQGGDVTELEHALEPLASSDRAKIRQGISFWTAMSGAQVALSKAPSDDPDRGRVSARLGELAAWSKPSVVLVTLDTTRVDHLSCYGYERRTTPKLDSLAARAVVYERAWSTSSWTLPAHASLFTGIYPSRHGADYDPRGGAVLGDVIGLPVARLMRAGKLPDDAVTLAELLAERGYATGAFVAGPWLHRSFGLLQGFAHQDDAVHTFGGRPAADITAAALAWLDGLAPGAPYFLFANYFDPHAPYEPVGRYAEFPRAEEPLAYDYDALMRGTRALDEDARAVLRDRYDAEIRDMDGSLGALLDAVHARPGGDRTLIVVTADHGEALGEEGRLGHGFWLTEELTRVPLIVRYSGDRDAGRRSPEPIQLVDVPSLVARELDLALPERSEGVAPGARRDAFLELRREPTTAARFGKAYDRDLQAVVRWPHKLTRSDDGKATLAHLSARTLAESPERDSSELDGLARLLDEHIAAGPPATVVPPDVEARTVEALRALGYVK